MGRLQSKKQHGAVETTSYTYNIRSWLKGITTTNNRFSETLYYNESSNGSIPCYNGNISAMNWKVQSDTQRGYNFHYDDLSRIAAADYQNNDANTDKNYSTTYAYDNMGNIKSLTRYGLSAKPSTFGMIDNLTLNYNGNQLSSVTDASSSEPSYTGAFNFVKASVGTPEYTYDANGNLTRDSHKKIAKIQYNILNLPSALQFTEGHTSEYLYDAAGVKRKVKQVTTTGNLLVPMGSMLPVPADKVAVTTQTDYCGNVIYENGALSRIIVDGGYITMSGTTPTYHYYIQDHQGNNRVVFNQSGTVEQANHYYPFGMTFGEGIDNSDNRYKYNSKELDRMHGLDWYDYGARMQTGMNFTTPDPLAEKYYSISPYAYCANNPIRFIDPDGKRVRMYVETNGVGHTFITIGEGKNTVVYTYGRYLGGDKGKSSSNSSDPTGRGVMLKLTGQDAQKYINHELKDLKATAYVIKDANEAKVQAHADKIYESGRKLTKDEATQYDSNSKKAGTSADAKVIDQYNLVGNNCTTKSIESVEAGGTSLDFIKTVGVTAPPVSSTQVPIFSPIGLKDYLDRKIK